MPWPFRYSASWPIFTAANTCSASPSPFFWPARAGLSTSMVQLILARVLQGVGAGAAFALVYTLLADIAAPGKRGKMMSIASFVWGLASVLGPPMGGFIVNYWSWRWIFFINLPLGFLSFLGIYLYYKETRVKKRRAALDLFGAATLTLTVLSLLTVFLMTGNHFRWLSLPIIGLLSVSLAGGVAFYYAEKHAADPILSIDFLTQPGFSTGNAAAFLSSFAIFSLAAFSPLFIQGALGKSPAEMGVAMIPLSLAWSGDDRWLAVGYGNGHILLKNSQKREERILTGHRGV
ncbi:MAG: MFS transporter, partial [Desulfuromonadales bacterium]